MDQRTNDFRLAGSNGRSIPTANTNRRARPSESDLAFANEALRNVERLVEDAATMTGRMEALEPRFKVAAMQKARIVVGAYSVVALILLISLAWSGSGIILSRCALVLLLVGLHFAPVHFFVGGELRADARLMRKLDNERLARAREAAKLGQDTSQELRARLGMEK
jgi:hypothetical protein